MPRLEPGAFEERSSHLDTAAREGLGLMIKGTSTGRYQSHRDLNTAPKMHVTIPKAEGQAEI